MFRVDDVEEVRVGVCVPYAVVLGRGPGVDPVGAEVEGGVALDVGEEDARVVWVPGDIALVLDRGGEGEDVLLELQADELLASDVAERLGAGGVGVVPRLVDLLGEVVDPAAVRGGEGEGGAQRGGGDGDGVVV